MIVSTVSDEAILKKKKRSRASVSLKMIVQREQERYPVIWWYEVIVFTSHAVV